MHPMRPSKSWLTPAAVALAMLVPAHAENIVVLNVEPTKEHPRNSEGSFATLASGRILFCYSQFYGGAADESPARIVRIQSVVQGRTWSAPGAFGHGSWSRRNLGRV